VLIKGIDDLLYRKGPELALYLIEHATPAKPPRKRVPLSDGVEATNGATAPAPAAARKQGQYEATGDKLILWRPAGEELIPMPLANFDARITSEIVKDDGTEQRRFYEITATYKENSYTFQVAATEFGSLNWVADRLPAECLCYAGRGIKDHLPVAIKSLSGTIPRRTIFTHTGWADVGSQKVYLHTGAAIGARGVVEGIQVELPAELGQFRLPPLGQGKELIEAIYTTLKFLDVAPRRITVPLFLTAYRAALGEANFSVFLYGESGVRKTSLAAIVQQHFGAAMDYDHAPSNWESTGNFIETLAHAAKDAVLLIDDFVPSGSRHDVERKYALADRLFRGQANRQGRGRLQSDTSYRATRKPRGIPVGTGEELPRGRSLQARMLSILVVPGDVDLDLLKKVQDDAGDGQFSMAMAGFIHYVAENFEEVQQQRRLQNQAAREAAALTTAHGRGVAIRMELSSTANILSRFFTHAGAMTETNAREWLNSIDQALAEVACEREEQEQEVDTARRSLEFLQTAITRGDAYLTDSSEEPLPEHPARYGWRKQPMVGTSTPGFVWEPRGNHIGWVDDEGIYLDPAAAFAAIQHLARATDDPLTTSTTAWRRSLHEKGFLKKKETKRGVYTYRKTLGDGRKDVLWLFPETLGGTKSTDHSDHDQFGISD
jgi:hypothetical protein